MIYRSGIMRLFGGCPEGKMNLELRLLHPPTQYLDKATGKFIVVNDATGNVIQVSGPGFRPNPPAR
jgi:hypothetical protein